MPDVLMLAGVLLVAGPAIATIGLSYPPLWRVWTVPREEHLAIVAAHRRAWTIANVGFTAATILTSGGLVILAGSVDADARWKAILMAGAVAYAIAGTLWCAVLAIRTRTTPALAAMVAAGTPTEPVETILGALSGGLYSAFLLTTGVALVAIGLTLAQVGGVGGPVTWLATLIAALAVARFVTSGDVIPAVIYFPTLLIGLALLLGWT